MALYEFEGKRHRFACSATLRGASQKPTATTKPETRRAGLPLNQPSNSIRWHTERIPRPSTNLKANAPPTANHLLSSYPLFIRCPMSSALFLIRLRPTRRAQARS